MSEQVMGQLFGNPMVLGVVGGIMIFMGLIPGMPNLAFLTLGAAACAGAYYSWKKQQQELLPAEPEAVEQEVPAEARDLSWEDVGPVDIIGLEVGYRLIPLVDRAQGGQMMERIKGVRKKLSQELGFLIQPVHIRDNLELAPNAYRILLMGVPVGEAEIYPDRELAINPGRVFGTLQGVETRDPAFGLEAVWISPAERDNATTLGYTVVDASTVVATHLSELLQSHAHELIGHEEVQQLLDVLAKNAPKLVEDLVPKTLSIGIVLKVLQNLLEERIPVKDMRTIAETLAEAGARSQDPGALTAAVRVSLGRSIVQHINGMGPELEVITLDPSLEQILQSSIQAISEGGAGIEPGLAERMHQSLAESAQRQEAAGKPAILLVTPAIRSWLARLVRHSIPMLNVLAYNEIPDNKQIKVVANIGTDAPALGTQAGNTAA